MVVVDQPIKNPISGPSFDFTFTFGPELDNIISGNFFIKRVYFENIKTKILSRQEAFRSSNLPRQLYLKDVKEDRRFK